MSAASIQLCRNARSSAQLRCCCRSRAARPGPVTLAVSQENLPTRAPVKLRKSQLRRLLGAEIEPARVEATLKSLQMQVETVADGWVVKPPTHRFDIIIEADLIEEVARIIGFDAIAEVDAPVAQQFSSLPEEIPPERAILETLTSRGWFEAINYAFTDPARQARLFPERKGLVLANAIASDLSVMRVSLWPGLLNAALGEPAPPAGSHPPVRARQPLRGPGGWWHGRDRHACRRGLRSACS